MTSFATVNHFTEVQLVILCMAERAALGKWKHLSFHSLSSHAILHLWLRYGYDNCLTERLLLEIR